MASAAIQAASTAGESHVTLSRLSVRDFRNLVRLDVSLPEAGMAVVGDNGHGKTNLLEAIYYLQLLRSFRGAHDRELVRFGAEGFYMEAEIIGSSVRQIAVGFDGAARRKRVRTDGLTHHRLADAIGVLPAVIFSPQDVTMISGPPGVRRRFLDVMLSLTSRSYLTALQQYRVALANRNAALHAKSTGSAAESATIWEPALASYGAILWTARQQWVSRSARTFSEICAAIGEPGASALSYTTSLADASPSVSNVEFALRDALARRREADVRQGLTHTGPHRDDLHLELDGKPLRTFGSSGQQRTAAIALRLLEAAAVRASTGREPIILLDDPFAELDIGRATRILELLNADGRAQTVLAVPRESDVPAGLTRLERWRIADGKVRRNAA